MSRQIAVVVINVILWFPVNVSVCLQICMMYNSLHVFQRSLYFAFKLKYRFYHTPLDCHHHNHVCIVLGYLFTFPVAHIHIHILWGILITCCFQFLLYSSNSPYLLVIFNVDIYCCIEFVLFNAMFMLVCLKNFVIILIFRLYTKFTLFVIILMLVEFSCICTLDLLWLSEGSFYF